MNHETGKSGEQLALDYMIRQGYQLVNRNYRCKIGEIDLILMKGNTLIFMEVKTRSSLKYGLPRESVTIAKQRTISRTALQYIQRYKIKNLNFRFDVVEIYRNLNAVKVVHIPNAFSIQS